jgi:hypothetical protein
MKKSLYLLLLVSSSLHSKIPVIGSALNELEGLLGHHLYGYSDCALKPEHEAFVRATAEQMGITEAFSVYSSVHASRHVFGPHVRGNRLYLDDAWFEEYKNFPEALRFVVGHELAHIEKQHVPLKHLASLVTITFSPMILTAALNRTSIPQTIAESVPERWREDAMTLLGYGTSLLAVTAGALIYFKLSRSQEYEADLFSLEKLSPKHGRKKLVKGAALFFARETSFAPESFMRRSFSTHPNSRERLKALSFPESASREAGEKMLSFTKKLALRFFCSIFGVFDEQEYSALWKEIVTAAQLVSVHESIAQEYATKIHSQITHSFTVLEESTVTKSISSIIAQEWEKEDCALLAQYLRQCDKASQQSRSERIPILLEALLTDYGALKKIMLQGSHP